MPSLSDLISELQSVANSSGTQAANDWLRNQLMDALRRIGCLRGTVENPRNVIFYASGWLQKPQVPANYLMVGHEDINGFMATMHGMDWSRNLTLIIHTPGGVGAAAQTIMAYLQAKFAEIDAIVPTYAMSAGTMMALGTDKIVMGRQSQLGPIDAQLNTNFGSVSAAAITEQFRKAKEEIAGPQGSLTNAHVWAPILQSMGPALLIEAQNALDYGAAMVSEWLEKRMCAKGPNPKAAASSIADHFNAATVHKHHGKRIDRNEARSKGIDVEDLEADQNLQEAVLTAYHAATIAFETSSATKMIASNASDRWWVRNYQIVQVPQIKTPAAVIPAHP